MDRDALVTLAFERIADSGWDTFSLSDLRRKEISLQDIARAFTHKEDILEAFCQMMGRALEASPFTFTDADTPVDRLFEVVMARLDLLAPYKDACTSIFAHFEHAPLEGAVFFHGLRTQAERMTRLASLTPPPLFFASAFGAFYGALLMTWAKDRDPNLEETMAFCHKGLGKLCDFFQPSIAA
ncbi:MAG: hypothetical protein C0514_03125 [Candidatus Puniceispirillum sp.]|nr:hypothetical protein [Candidatus Puniceispirillum sp.]